MSPMTNDPESARMGRPGLERRPLKVIGIGAGASGLLLAYKIQRNFEDIDLTIYEKNDGVAGTWFEVRDYLQNLCWLAGWL
jgi:hypothetical protein